MPSRKIRKRSSSCGETSNIFPSPTSRWSRGQPPTLCPIWPAPDAVFIGGSSGNIGEIVRLCLAKNPQVRIVATAITLETVAQLLEAARGLPEVSLEISQISAARAQEHLARSSRCT